MRALGDSRFQSNPWWKILLTFFGSLIVVGFGLIVLVQLIARFVWALPGSSDLTISGMRAIAAQAEARAELFEAVGHHRVEEWPVVRERDFSEAPTMRALVEQGTLPPVGERLPAEPLVIVPPEQRGPYGGSWTRYDISQIGHIVNMLFRLGNESLIRWDPGGDYLIANIAKRWESSDDAREHTIYLREGIRWSDGHPFTARDILFWWEEYMQHDFYTGMVPVDFMRAGEPMEVEKVDDHTFRFRFKEPNPLLPKQLASFDPYMHMLQYPKHYLKQFHVDYVSEQEMRRLVSEESESSPRSLFRSKQGYLNHECPRLWAWIPEDEATTQRWIFKRNPYYWKVDDAGNQLPYIERLVFEWMDAELINLRFIAGQMGMQARRVSFDNYALFKREAAAGGYRVLEWEMGGGGPIALGFNLNRRGDPFLHDLFNDSRFRIAMSHAINRDEINEVQFLGIGKPRQMAPPRSSAYYSEELANAHIEFDPEKANRLLDEIGLTERTPDGFRRRPDGSPLQIMLDTSDAMGSQQAIRLIAAHWRAVGVDARMRMMSGPLIDRRQDTRQHDVAMFWGENEKNAIIDPRYFVPIGLGADWAPDYRQWYGLRFHAEALDEDVPRGVEPPEDFMRLYDIYDKILVEPDPEERLRLWQKINDIHQEELYVMGIVGYVPQLILVNNTFRNVPDNAIYGFTYRSPGVTAPECFSIDEEER